MSLITIAGAVVGASTTVVASATVGTSDLTLLRISRKVADGQQRLIWPQIRAASPLRLWCGEEGTAAGRPKSAAGSAGRNRDYARRAVAHLCMGVSEIISSLPARVCTIPTGSPANWRAELGNRTLGVWSARSRLALIEAPKFSNNLRSDSYGRFSSGSRCGHLHRNYNDQHVHRSTSLFVRCAAQSCAAIVQPQEMAPGRTSAALRSRAYTHHKLVLYPSLLRYHIGAEAGKDAHDDQEQRSGLKVLLWRAPSPYLLSGRRARS
jgi:hypothetical protein